jgi:hypothetical protein
VLAFANEKRTNRVKMGEKAPYWLTLFYVTRADGQVFIPPWLVHQAEELSEFFTLYLPDDWGVSVTPSGYMDKKSFVLVCRHFLRYCNRPAGSKRPLFLYIDGADGHWAADALQTCEMMDNNVFVRLPA